MLGIHFGTCIQPTIYTSSLSTLVWITEKATHKRILVLEFTARRQGYSRTRVCTVRENSIPSSESKCKVSMKCRSDAVVSHDSPERMPVLMGISIYIMAVSDLSPVQPSGVTFCSACNYNIPKGSAPSPILQEAMMNVPCVCVHVRRCVLYKIDRQRAKGSRRLLPSIVVKHLWKWARLNKARDHFQQHIRLFSLRDRSFQPQSWTLYAAYKLNSSLRAVSWKWSWKLAGNDCVPTAVGGKNGSLYFWPASVLWPEKDICEHVFLRWPCSLRGSPWRLMCRLSAPRTPGTPCRLSSSPLGCVSGFIPFLTYSQHCYPHVCSWKKIKKRGLFLSVSVLSTVSGKSHRRLMASNFTLLLLLLLMDLRIFFRVPQKNPRCEILLAIFVAKRAGN